MHRKRDLDVGYLLMCSYDVDEPFARGPPMCKALNRYLHDFSESEKSKFSRIFFLTLNQVSSVSGHDDLDVTCLK